MASAAFTLRGTSINIVKQKEARVSHQARVFFHILAPGALIRYLCNLPFQAHSGWSALILSSAVHRIHTYERLPVTYCMQGMRVASEWHQGVWHTLSKQHGPVLDVQCLQVSGYEPCL